MREKITSSTFTHWNLDANGLLTLKGWGKMPDWEYHLDDRKADTPWYERRTAIKAVHISDGFNNIGKCAFRDCENLTTVYIPNSVTKLDDNVFNKCKKLKRVYMPSRFDGPLFKFRYGISKDIVIFT